MRSPPAVETVRFGNDRYFRRPSAPRICRTVLELANLLGENSSRFDSGSATKSPAPLMKNVTGVCSINSAGQFRGHFPFAAPGRS